MDSLSIGDFVIPLPSDWRVEQTVVAWAGRARRFRPNIVMAREPLKQGETLDDFVKRTWSSLRQIYPNLSLIDEGPVSLGRCQAYRKKYILRPDEDAESKQHSSPQGLTQSSFSPQQTMAQSQYYVRSHDEVFSLTASDSPDNFDATRCVAEAMIAQLHLESSDRVAAAFASEWE